MALLNLAVLFVCMSVCLACEPNFPYFKFDQSSYCYADFVFEANVGKWEYKLQAYRIVVNKVYKGNAVNIPLAIERCAENNIYQGKTFLIYAKNVKENQQIKFRILKSRYITFLTEADKERLKKYDCSCKIYIHDGVPSHKLPAPAKCKDQCNAPNNSCPSSGFCQRDSNKACTWIETGRCY